jgi:hypothetical protein
MGAGGGVPAADFLSGPNCLEAGEGGLRIFASDEQGLGISARYLALLLPLALVGCLTDGDDNGRSLSFTGDRGVDSQPFPGNYRSEILAFMKTYLNNPAGLHDTAMAEPMQRTVGGRLRYVSCLRYAAREAEGGYREAHEHAIVYVDGRLDRVVENAGELCAGASYSPFPELAGLTR